MKNVLILSTCAGIFHWSGSNMFWCGAEKKATYRKALSHLHGGEEAENANREYEYKLDVDGTPIININGVEVRANDKMIQHIEGDFERCDVINGITFADLSNFKNTNWKINSIGGGFIAHSNKFNSLGIDCFCEGLRFYRILFNRNIMEIVFSGGKFYKHENQMKKPISIKDIFDICGVKSKAARKELQTILEYIQQI